MEYRRKNIDCGEFYHHVRHRVVEYKFGKLFTPIPRYDRWKTQRSSFGSSENNFDRPALISKIYHLLTIHSEQRVRNDIKGTKCSHNLHRALHKAIRLCYEQRIYESKLFPVGDLFLELFLCDGNLNAIFSILYGHVSETSHLMNANVNTVYPEHVHDCQHAFEYYLHHASSLTDQHYGAEMRNLNVVNKEIDHNTTPLSAAIQKRDPELVLSLLRFGADPFLALGQAQDGEERSSDPMQLLLEDINGLFLFRNTGFSAQTKQALAAEQKKAWTCLKYIRRSVIAIPIEATSHINTVTEDEECEIKDTVLMEQRKYQLHPDIAESLNMDIFKASASLQHICRTAVRSALTTAQVPNIPWGIQMLPLPKPLKLYLDLKID